MPLDLKSSEIEHTFIRDRLSNVEKHFLDMSSKIASYTKEQAKLRDSGNEVAKSILLFASSEVLNQTLRQGLGEFSDILSCIQEYRDAQVQRTEIKVIHELSRYKNICKEAKVDLKKCFDARAKELVKRNNLEKTRQKNPLNWHKITQAETEVSDAKDEAIRKTQDLSRQINTLEKRKIEDLKRVFMEFVKIELAFHAKSIELYTKAYNAVKNINVENDIHEFQSHFQSCMCNFDSENPAIKIDNKALQSKDTTSEIPDLNLSRSEISKCLPGPSISSCGTKSVSSVKSCSSQGSFAQSEASEHLN